VAGGGKNHGRIGAGSYEPLVRSTDQDIIRALSVVEEEGRSLTGSRMKKKRGVLGGKAVPKASLKGGTNWGELGEEHRKKSSAENGLPGKQEAAWKQPFIVENAIWERDHPEGGGKKKVSWDSQTQEEEKKNL